MNYLTATRQYRIWTLKIWTLYMEPPSGRPLSREEFELERLMIEAFCT